MFFFIQNDNSKNLNFFSINNSRKLVLAKKKPREDLFLRKLIPLRYWWCFKTNFKCQRRQGIIEINKYWSKMKTCSIYYKDEFFITPFCWAEYLMSWYAIVCSGGNINSSHIPFKASSTILNSNHFTSSISSLLTMISSVKAVAWQPIINEQGNGHGCDEIYFTWSTFTPWID